MGKSTRSRLDVSAPLGLLQYWHVCQYWRRPIKAEASRRETSQTTKQSCSTENSMKLVILASIARVQRSTTHVDVNLWRLPPSDPSGQKSDLAQKIQRHCLQSLCTAATPSKWWMIALQQYSTMHNRWCTMHNTWQTMRNTWHTMSSAWCIDG